MKIDIKNKKQNPFFNRREIKGVIDHTGEATPSEEALQEFLSKSLKEEKDSIEVDKIFTRKGENVSDFWAKIKGIAKTKKKKSKKKKVKKKPKEKYEEILKGTISEGKKQINKLKKPDYEKLLRLEKKGKDRKGMKNFLKKKIK